MGPVGFVGLGAMGRPMARRLLDAGLDVVGYNRTQERARALLRLALDLGRASGVPLPTTALAHEWLTAAAGLGLGPYDFAVLRCPRVHERREPEPKGAEDRIGERAQA